MGFKSNFSKILSSISAISMVVGLSVISTSTSNADGSESTFYNNITRYSSSTYVPGNDLKTINGNLMSNLGKVTLNSQQATITPNYSYGNFDFNTTLINSGNNLITIGVSPTEPTRTIVYTVYDVSSGSAIQVGASKSFSFSGSLGGSISKVEAVYNGNTPTNIIKLTIKGFSSLITAIVTFDPSTNTLSSGNYYGVASDVLSTNSHNYVAYASYSGASAFYMKSINNNGGNLGSLSVPLPSGSQYKIQKDNAFNFSNDGKYLAVTADYYTGSYSYVFLYDISESGNATLKYMIPSGIINTYSPNVKFTDTNQLLIQANAYTLWLTDPITSSNDVPGINKTIKENVSNTITNSAFFDDKVLTFSGNLLSIFSTNQSSHVFLDDTINNSVGWNNPKPVGIGLVSNLYASSIVQSPNGKNILMSSRTIDGYTSWYMYHIYNDGTTRGYNLNVGDMTTASVQFINDSHYLLKQNSQNDPKIIEIDPFGNKVLETPVSITVGDNFSSMIVSGNQKHLLVTTTGNSTSTPTYALYSINQDSTITRQSILTFNKQISGGIVTQIGTDKFLFRFTDGEVDVFDASNNNTNDVTMLTAPGINPNYTYSNSGKAAYTRTGTSFTAYLLDNNFQISKDLGTVDSGNSNSAWESLTSTPDGKVVSLYGTHGGVWIYEYNDDTQEWAKINYSYPNTDLLAQSKRFFTNDGLYYIANFNRLSTTANYIFKIEGHSEGTTENNNQINVNPSDLTNVTTSYGTSVFSWPAISDPRIIGYVATAYSSGESDRVINVGPSVHSVTFTNLTKGKSWSFKLQILTNDGLSDPIESENVPVIFPENPIDPPSNVTFENGELTWPVGFDSPGQTYRACFYSTDGSLISCENTSDNSITAPSNTGTGIVSKVDDNGNPGSPAFISQAPNQVIYDDNGKVIGSSENTTKIYPPNGNVIIVSPGEHTTVPNGSIISETPSEGLEVPVSIPLNIDRSSNGDVTISWPQFPLPSVIGYRVTGYQAGYDDVIQETDAYNTSVTFHNLPNYHDWNFKIDVITVQGIIPVPDSPETEGHNQSGEGNEGSGDINLEVPSTISLTLDDSDDSIHLAGIPGSTNVTIDDNQMKYSVTTNNIEGYTVTIKSDQSELTPATQENDDTVSSNLIEVSQSDSQNGTGTSNTSLSTSGNELYSQNQRSTESGDSFTSTFNLTEVPWVNADDYTGTVTYTATAN